MIAGSIACRPVEMAPAHADPAMYELPHFQLAHELSSRLLADHNMDWGEPMNMHVDGSVYWVTYATPKDEVPLIGYRSVLVNVTTETVEFVGRD